MKKILHLCLITLALAAVSLSSVAVAKDKIGPIGGRIESIDRTAKTILTLDGEHYQVARSLKVKTAIGAYRVRDLKVGDIVTVFIKPAKGAAYPEIVSLELIWE